LIAGSAYEPWRLDLEHFVRDQKLGPRWRGMKELFKADFAGHIDGLVRQSGQTPRSPVETGV
jgi:hypothetical protein